MFIAEIGINHNGSLDLAKQLIKMAKDAGADVVKFQKRDPDICVPENEKNKIRNTPWGEMTYLDYKKKIEFEKNEYDEIDRYCKEIGIKWTASIWDINSLDFIMQYDIPFIKLASACITNDELLDKINDYGKPVVMSIGMSTEEEMNHALIKLYNCDMTILHCNSSYPASDNELDLNVIKRLKKKFKGFYTIGYSGHELGIEACIVAKTLGAEVIERHITLDKNMWGTDQKASLEFDELKKLIDCLNKIPVWLGNDKITVYPSEERVKEKLRVF